MSGSRHYLLPLEALHDLFVQYPVRADLSSIHIATDHSGKASILVRLRQADPAVLAAGIVEWRRTLSKGTSWAWRAPSGKNIHVVTTGYVPECGGIPLTVVAGPVPLNCCLDLDLEIPEELDDDSLYRWLGDEIANNWPFEPTLLTGDPDPGA
jgi:hypothetical protein